MKIVSARPVIEITKEEEKAILVVAELLNSIRHEIIDKTDIDIDDMLDGVELADAILHNYKFDCRVAEGE